MSFTVIGQAPARNTHAYLYIKCDACGVEREARASRYRAGKVTCSCLASAPSTGRASQADPQIQNFPGTLAAGIEMHEAKHGPIGARRLLTDLPADLLNSMSRHPRADPVQDPDPAQQDFASLEKRVQAYMANTDKLIAQQAADFASWRQKWERDMRAFMENVQIGPVPAGAAARKKITYQSIVADLRHAGRTSALWVSHRRGAELADLPFEKRTDEAFAELADRFEIITEQLDTCTDKALYAALQPYMAKMNRSLNCWASEHYDPTEHPLNTETSA